MTVLVGTSGWQYADWKQPYYAGVAQRRWYEHHLAGFATVELNVAFYRLPRRETFEGWQRRAPADAVVAVKVSRYLTHIRRLRDPEEPVQRLLSVAAGLGPRLGPFLLQLPPDLTADAAALDRTLGCFPPTARVAVEPRHPSWWVDDVRAVLERRRAALVWADRHGQSLGPLWRTADWGYLRLHEGDSDRWPFYRRETLDGWVERLAATWNAAEDAFAYFNNDPGCAALDDAVTFAEEADRHGVARTRVPERPRLG